MGDSPKEAIAGLMTRLGRPLIVGVDEVGRGCLAGPVIAAAVLLRPGFSLAGASANRMHLLSAISGLSELKRRVRVHLYTVSDYLKDGATSWVPGWKQRGWKTREGKPVSHRDLWQKLDELANKHRVEWHVVDKNDMPADMEYAKQLAKDALKLDA